MATPSKKSAELERALSTLFGTPRVECIEADVCVPSPIGCGGPATDFDDELSRKEYSISGLCQKCQNEFFGEKT